MDKKPIIHTERNSASNVRFAEDRVAIDLADGRTLVMPLDFFPWLQAASDSQRENHIRIGLNIYWEELDEGIDLTAMLTGLYTKPKPKPESVPGHASLVTT